eukprot:302572_1
MWMLGSRAFSTMRMPFIGHQKIVAKSLAEASKAAPMGGVLELILRDSEDLICRNILCGKIGQGCACRLAVSLDRNKRLCVLDVSGGLLDVLPSLDSLHQSLLVLRIARNPLNKGVALNAVESIPGLCLLVTSHGQLDDTEERCVRVFAARCSTLSSTYLGYAMLFNNIA